MIIEGHFLTNLNIKHGENKDGDDDGGYGENKLGDDDDDLDKNSKLLLTALSSSLSFYVYYGKHGNPRQVKFKINYVMSRFFFQCFAAYNNVWQQMSAQNTWWY